MLYTSSTILTSHILYIARANPTSLAMICPRHILSTLYILLTPLVLHIAGKGTAQFSRQDMFKADSGVGIEMTDRVFKLAPCHDIPRGSGMLQNLPSTVVAHVLNPSPGARVLDMCASPGGKALCNLKNH